MEDYKSTLASRDENPFESYTQLVQWSNKQQSIR
jgi:hypothetical protein